MEADMKKLIIGLFSFCFVMAGISELKAWPDGKKEGFVLGFHGGGSSTTISKSDSDDTDGSGFHVGPYLGFGVNEQMLISLRVRYIQTSSNDSDAEYYTTMFGGDFIFFPVINMGLFINAGLAKAIAASKSTAEPPWGTVFYAGLGYFFNNTIFIEADYAMGSFDNDMSTGTVSLSVGAMLY
jgi:hypothetical protein